MSPGPSDSKGWRSRSGERGAGSGDAGNNTAAAGNQIRAALFQSVLGEGGKMLPEVRMFVFFNAVKRKRKKTQRPSGLNAGGSRVSVITDLVKFKFLQPALHNGC